MNLRELGILMVESETNELNDKSNLCSMLILLSIPIGSHFNLLLLRSSSSSSGKLWRFKSSICSMELLLKYMYLRSREGSFLRAKYSMKLFRMSMS